MTIRSQGGEVSREREGRERPQFKARGPSYRHDPRRAVSVGKPLKHPELHSLIDTVTHLGGWKHEGWLCCTLKRLNRKQCSDRQRNDIATANVCCRVNRKHPSDI